MKKYEVVTLCGSTKFKDEFIKAQKELTLQGYIVISVGFFGNPDNEPISEKQKEMLADMHMKKIDMADIVYIVNVGGYIGESTRSELKHARLTGKTVISLEPINEE